MPGSYLALLASSAGGPFARFDNGGAPWRRVDGVRITATAAEFAAQASGTFHATFVNRNAAGEPLIVFGARIGGVGAHCQDWTSTDPDEAVPAGWPTSAEVDDFWSLNSTSCTASSRILCAQA